MLHKHYVKPMASRAVVRADSAFSASKRKAILLEEGSRILKNCSPCLPWGEKQHFLNIFSICMMEAGHSESFRAMILTRVVSKYQVSLCRHMSGEKELYRTRCEREACWAELGWKGTKVVGSFRDPLSR